MYLYLVFALIPFFYSQTAPPELSKGQLIQDGNQDIRVASGHLVPCVVDWNNDGKKDLLIGQFRGGKIRLYLNKGTDEKPCFNGFEFLKAREKEISLEAG